MLGYNELSTPAPSLAENTLLIVTANYPKEKDSTSDTELGLFIVFCIEDTTTYVNRVEDNKIEVVQTNNNSGNPEV